MTQEKLNALITYFQNTLEENYTEGDVEELEENFYETPDGLCHVYTDEEADEACVAYIKEHIYDFDVEFMAYHMDCLKGLNISQYQEAIRGLFSIKQSLGEVSAPILLALIGENIDRYVNDLIMEEGRGTFLSYNEEEIEINGFYVYYN